MLESWNKGVARELKEPHTNTISIITAVCKDALVYILSTRAGENSLHSLFYFTILFTSFVLYASLLILIRHCLNIVSSSSELT